MDDTVLMRVFERLRDVDEHRHDVEIALATQPAQISARGELHRQRDEIALAIRRVHLEDGRMIHPARDGVLAAERGPRSIVVRELRAQNLESNLDAALIVTRTPDFRLTACPQLLEQCVTRGARPSVA